MTIAEQALGMIANGNVVGLGSGRAATSFIHALGQRVQAGLRIRGVPTSQNSAALARELGIPLATLEEVTELDIDVDGADEVDPQLDLIKGLGGALVREKIVAAAARQLVILVGTEKVVAQLGSRGVLPVEVIPFGVGLCQRRLAQLGLPGRLRMVNGSPFVTDNSNYILDLQVEPLADPPGLEKALTDIPGVVDTGLFLGMTHLVLIQDGAQVEVRKRPL